MYFCVVFCALLLSNAAPTSILNFFNCGVNHGLFLLIVQAGLRGHALLRAFVKNLVGLSTIWFSFFSVMVWVWFHPCFSSSASNSWWQFQDFSCYCVTNGVVV